MKYMNRPKNAAVKDIDIDIDIADILGQKYWYHIDIGKCDIDPSLIHTIYPKISNSYCEKYISEIRCQ